MSDADNSSFPGFGKFVPGFDFLQNLATQAASHSAQKSPQLPGLGSWVAPTLNVEELDKRIQELKAVQFWLDQNAMALKATIQALEVQKMTLATLKGMNFNMGDLASAFKLKMPESPPPEVDRPPEKPRTFAGLEIPPVLFQTPVPDAAEEPVAVKASVAPPVQAPAAGGVVDPLQWWGALTQQFQTIAADAMKEAAKKTTLDGSQGFATGLAKDAIKTATGIAKGMGKTAADGAQAAMTTALRSSQAWPSPLTTRNTAAAKTASRAKPKAQPKAKDKAQTKTPAAAPPSRKAAHKTVR